MGKKTIKVIEWRCAGISGGFEISDEESIDHDCANTRLGFALALLDALQLHGKLTTKITEIDLVGEKKDDSVLKLL